MVTQSICWSERRSWGGPGSQTRTPHGGLQAHTQHPSSSTERFCCSPAGSGSCLKMLLSFHQLAWFDAELASPSGCKCLCNFTAVHRECFQGSSVRSERKGQTPEQCCQHTKLHSPVSSSLQTRYAYFPSSWSVKPDFQYPGWRTNVWFLTPFRPLTQGKACV